MTQSFCLELTRQANFCKLKNFKLLGLHYESDGLRATMKCDLDEKKYEIKIKPI